MRCAAAVRSVILDAEEVWLDVQAPEFTRRMQALEWRPDRPDAYCGRCGQSVGPHGAGPEGCGLCAGRRLPWSRIIRLGEYRPPLSRFVHEVKFTRWRRLGVRLGHELGTAVALANHAAATAESTTPRRILVVPVPTTFRRRLRRGIDHSGAIAVGAAAVLGAKVGSGLLRRKHRASQLAVLPSERESNIAGSITPRRAMDLSGVFVLVVDDVTTTGATLRATARAVWAAHRQSGGKGKPVVWGAVAAVTALEGAGKTGTAVGHALEQG